MVDSSIPNCLQEPLLYVRHGLLVSSYPKLCSNKASDWKQIRKFYEWPLLERLGERGRMNQAAFKSLGWSCSLEAWRSHRKLEKLITRFCFSAVKSKKVLWSRRRKKQSLIGGMPKPWVDWKTWQVDTSTLFLDTRLSWAYSDYRFPPITMLNAACQSSVSCILPFQRTSYCQKTKLDYKLTTSDTILQSWLNALFPPSSPLYFLPSPIDFGVWFVDVGLIQKWWVVQR